MARNLVRVWVQATISRRNVDPVLPVREEENRPRRKPPVTPLESLLVNVRAAAGRVQEPLGPSPLPRQAREAPDLRVQKVRVVREGKNSRNRRELASVGVPQGLHRKARNARSRPRRGVDLTAVKRRPARRASPCAVVGVPGAKAKAGAGAGNLPRLSAVRHPGKNVPQIPAPQLARPRRRIKRLAPNRKTGRRQGRRDAAGVRVRDVAPGQRRRL